MGERLMVDDEDDDGDLFTYHARTSDPETAHAAGRRLKPEGLMWQVLLSLRHGLPRNGWEIATAMAMTDMKDTVVPRLAPLRRQGAITEFGPRRPGPTGVAQIAYVITDTGRAILRHEKPLLVNPPLEPWEQRSLLQQWLWRALQEGWTDELRTEVSIGFATYRPGVGDGES
jgi:hypothetical protein